MLIFKKSIKILKIIATIAVLVPLLLIILWTGKGIIDEISDRVWHTVKVDTPSGILSANEIGRFRAYGRLSIAEEYYDLGEYGYLVYVDKATTSPSGEEYFFGYRDIAKKELKKITKNYKRKLTENKILDFFGSQYEYNQVRDKYRYIPLFDPSTSLNETDTLGYSIFDLGANQIKFTDKISGYSINLPSKYRLESRFPSHIKLVDTQKNKTVGIIENIRVDYKYGNWQKAFRSYSSNNSNSYTQIASSLFAYKYSDTDENADSKSINYLVNTNEGAIINQIIFFKAKGELEFTNAELTEIENIVKTYRKQNDGWIYSNHLGFSFHAPKNTQIKTDNFGNGKTKSFTIVNNGLNVRVYLFTGNQRESKYELEQLIAQKTSGFTDATEIDDIVEFINPKTKEIKRFFKETYIKDQAYSSVLIENSGSANTDFLLFIKAINQIEKYPNYGLEEYNGMLQ